MKQKEIRQILNDTDFVHKSGSEEELKVAEYLKKLCEGYGAKTEIESFRVPMANMKAAHLFADGKEVPCKGILGCGSGEIEGELYYMPGQDDVSIAGAKDKIVLLDTLGVSLFTYKDLMKAGAKGIIFRYGDANFPNSDIDERDLREAVVGEERKVLCVMVNVKEAVKLVKNNTKNVKIVVDQDEFDGESHNVVAELPGERDEYIVLSAHYDTTSLSHGAYDNMTGCIGILGVLEALSGKKHNYGLRFVFCGSEERGLLGSKAYVRDHESEVEKMVLNINLDMVGTYMGKFIASATAEDKVAHYISYMGAELGFPVSTSTGVYSSDSTSFADKGIPAVTFARAAGNAVAPIHCRYDRKDVVSLAQMQKDTDFIAEFTRRMADAMHCPVKREISEKLRKEIDEYLFRKRKDA